ncbi:GNAT family N-acetyltransferase [Acidimicrobiaceae bacterium USS-CC1]|uniref:GNAT family N-acetyltransferase n=1 Tax=Acidiferrimicrobium australe TaxID=2664430 RepID=A0ABW9QQK5_9ACTN|nr:GNAT family N-acetyltransferase [Acidiferrimicrobium australe]
MRAALPDDAERIGLAHVRSWQAAYAGHFPQEFLDGLDPARRAEGWRRRLEGSLPDREALLVAETSTGIAGFASVGPCRDDEIGAGGLYAIYLLPEVWGHGLGRQLMVASLEAPGRFDFDEATLWVLTGNGRARRFYEAGGWQVDGATKVDEGPGFPIAEVRYRVALPEGAPCAATGSPRRWPGAHGSRQPARGPDLPTRLR